jgi:hypothetical protein
VFLSLFSFTNTGHEKFNVSLDGMALKNQGPISLSNFLLLGGEYNGLQARGTELKLLNTLISKCKAANILTAKALIEVTAPAVPKVRLNAQLLHLLHKNKY